MLRWVFWLGVVGAVSVSGSAIAQDKPEKPKKAEKPKTVKVEKGPWQVEATLKGVFEAEKVTELSVSPEAWGQPLEVTKALKHGEAVKKGDVVVAFDTEKIDREIEALKVQLAISELSVELGERELPILEKLMPIELAAAARSAKIADEDLEAFLEVDRPLSEESAEFSVKSGEQRLKYAREELKQLQAMYRDKDLTEETEEMILQRQRFEVESAEFFLRMQKNNTEKTLEVQLPRREEMLKESAVKAAIEREKIKSTAALNIDQKRLALKKEQFDLTKTREKLEELEKDRALFEVKAPTDGVVYYGQAEDGQWSGVAVEAKKLDPGGKVQAGEVFVTVVQPRPMWVRVKVDEKELFKLSGKPKGEVSPNGFPEVALEAQVESVSAVPLAPGVFEAQVEVELTDESEMLMPGMACEFLMAQTLAEDVLTLPKSVVFRDGPGAAWHVYRPGKDGEKAEKVDVKLGKRGSDKVQVVEGLKEGDEVLTSKPE